MSVGSDRIGHVNSPRPSVPLTSLDPLDADIKGMHALVTACASQAQIALIHLARVWGREGDDFDPRVWAAVSDPLAVWADLQGAITAGIVLSRLLRPGKVHARKPLTVTESQTRSDARGVRLRSLLSVSNDSVLLTIGKVRNPIEHIDERFDSVIENDRVFSISDLYVAGELYFDDLLDSEENVDHGGVHVNMRTFLPFSGEVLYGDLRFDLFRFENHLLGLLKAVPEARQTLDGERTKDVSFAYGASRPLRISGEFIESRREALRRMRADLHSRGLHAVRVDDPSGLVLVVQQPEPGIS